MDDLVSTASLHDISDHGLEGISQITPVISTAIRMRCFGSTYTLANILIKEINPYAITVAEEMSGMLGLASPFVNGGNGFDFRMSMGVPDHWIKWIKRFMDED